VSYIFKISPNWKPDLILILCTSFHQPNTFAIWRRSDTEWSHNISSLEWSVIIIVVERECVKRCELTRLIEFLRRCLAEWWLSYP
jgi:hypothetical protein